MGREFLKIVQKDIFSGNLLITIMPAAMGNIDSGILHMIH